MEAFIGLLGIALGAVITHWQQASEHRRQRQNRADERAHTLADKIDARNNALADAHRAELRQAYAACLATYSRLLDAGRAVIVTWRTIEARKEGVSIAAAQSVYGEEQKRQYQQVLAGQAQLHERLRIESATFVTTATEAHTKAVDVILLEGETVRQKAMSTVADLRVALPHDAADCERFERDLLAARTQLDAFKWTLAGAFAPRLRLAAPAGPEHGAPTLPALPTPVGARLTDGADAPQPIAEPLVSPPPDKG